MPVGLFSLPLELRLHIYSYLHTPNLELNLCEDLTNIRLANINSSKKKRPSPLLSYLQRRSTTTQWSRKHGIHLCAPDIPARLRHEYVSLLQSTSTALMVHCPGCLDKILRHLVIDLGIKQALIPSLQMRIDMTSRWSWENEVINAVEELKLRVGYLYGNHLWDAIDDYGHRLRTCCIEVVRIVGRTPVKRRKRAVPDASGFDQGYTMPLVEDSMDIDNDVEEDDNQDAHADEQQQGDDDDDDDDDDDTDNDSLHNLWFRGRVYNAVDSVKILDRSTRRINVSNPLDQETESQIRHLVRQVVPAEEEGQWRRSRTLEREWEGKGRCIKRLVCREEVWVVIRMRS